MFQQYLNRGRATKANHLILDSRNRPALLPYAAVFDSKRNLLRNPLRVQVANCGSAG
jgi:hypothetical protein